MTLKENLLNEIKKEIEQNHFYDACMLIRQRINFMSPLVYNLLLCDLYRQMVIALSSKGAYLTPKTYELFMSLPLYRYEDDTKQPFMARTNELYKVINKVNNYQNELQFK